MPGTNPVLLMETFGGEVKIKEPKIVNMFVSVIVCLPITCLITEELVSEYWCEMQTIYFLILKLRESSFRFNV